MRTADRREELRLVRLLINTAFDAHVAGRPPFLAMAQAVQGEHGELHAELETTTIAMLDQVALLTETFAALDEIAALPWWRIVERQRRMAQVIGRLEAALGRPKPTKEWRDRVWAAIDAEERAS